MRVLVLGPVRVRVRSAESPRELRPAMVRRMCAVLASRPGGPVRVDELVEMFWPVRPPENAVKAVQLYAHRLRRQLGEEDRVVHRNGGYELVLKPDELDAREFADHVAAAGSMESAEARVRELDAALGLWRGTPYADVDCAALRPEIERLTELRLRALEERAQALLESGRTDEAVASLVPLVREFPFRERFAALLIAALARADRRDDALEVFRTARERLAEDLGIDPGADLTRVHEAVLRGEVPRTDAVPDGPPRPAQLPAELATFTGRALELEHLLSAVVDNPVPAYVISAIDGMAGVGKTAFAVRVAHRVADRFPDGQVFVDLRGYARGLEPLAPDTAQEQILRSLGVPGQQIPHDPTARTAFYRTHLADRNLLILLDNAVDEDQVRPLLPGAAGCLVLVTSRNRLGGMVGATPLSLDVLPDDDARDLFERIAGHAHPAEIVAEIVRLCGRLPLAIRIAAARLRARPTWSAADLAERLRDRDHRLEELATGDRSVTAAIDLSYGHLGPDLQRLYRLLGRHCGPDFEAYAVAALLDSSPEVAARMLRDLLDVHLLEEHRPDRYRFHDLVRAHAAECGEHDSAAPKRLCDHYCRTAAAMAAIAYPYRTTSSDRHESEHRAPIHNAERATAWLDDELPNLLAVSAHAAASEDVVHLSAALAHHLHVRGRYADAAALHQRALEWARTNGEPSGELVAHNNLGDICGRQGRQHVALEHFLEARSIARTLGERRGEIAALNGLGNVDRVRGRYPQATESFRQALTIAREVDDRAAQITTLNNLGDAHGLQDQFERAIEQYECALRLADEIGHRPGALAALRGLGYVHQHQGRNTQAADHFERALKVARELGNTGGVVIALNGLGTVRRLQERVDQAIECHQEALGLATDTGYRGEQFEALHGLGRTYLSSGRAATALGHHRSALELALSLEQPADQARAHSGLADAYHQLGQSDSAAEHWQQALNLLEEIGLSQYEEISATEIRAKLG